MKKIFIATFILFAANKLNAQVTENRLIIDSISRSAFYFESDLSEDDVKDAIKDYFDSIHISMEKGTGFIIKKQLPFMEFKHAVADTMDGVPLDFYFKVDVKKIKGPDITTIFVAASKSGNNFISLQSDPVIWKNFKNFSTYLQTNYFVQYWVRQNIASVTKDLAKQKDKLKDVEAEKLKLENDIASKNAQLASLRAQLNKLKGIEPVKDSTQQSQTPQTP